ncbi:MAG: hypothetical protein MHPSP_001556 [Paramarteilia canceri]
MQKQQIDKESLEKEKFEKQLKALLEEEAKREANKTLQLRERNRQTSNALKQQIADKKREINRQVEIEKELQLKRQEQEDLLSQMLQQTEQELKLQYEEKIVSQNNS